MKRSATDVLRRGFDLTVANWPVIVIRIVETLLLVLLTVGFVIAAIIPIAVSAGIGNFNDLASVPNAAAAIVNHWMAIVYILAVISILLVVFVAIHSFVDGGIAQVLIDGEHAGAKASFDMSRLLSGGASSWWAIFWLYNIVWSIAALILLVPLIATLALAIIVDSNGARVAVSCAGLALTVLISLPIGIIVAVWTQKAIAVCVGRKVGALESMRIARLEMAGDLGRHLIVAFVAIVVSIGGAMLISMISMPFSFMHQGQPLFALMTAPVQIVVSFAQSSFSAAAGIWFLASFIVMTEER